MNEILKQFTQNNIAGGSYERISITSLINNLDATKSVVLQCQVNPQLSVITQQVTQAWRNQLLQIKLI